MIKNNAGLENSDISLLAIIINNHPGVPYNAAGSAL
jgi:hypothetical protein